jgi:hypothetical protein
VSLTIGVFPTRSARLSGISRIGGETVIAAEGTGAVARRYSQKAMIGTPMIVVL